MLRPEETHWDQAADAAVADWAMSQRRHPELVPARLSCERLCVKMLACKLISSNQKLFCPYMDGKSWAAVTMLMSVYVCVSALGVEGFPGKQ